MVELLGFIFFSIPEVEAHFPGGVNKKRKGAYLRVIELCHHSCRCIAQIRPHPALDSHCIKFLLCRNSLFHIHIGAWANGLNLRRTLRKFDKHLIARWIVNFLPQATDRKLVGDSTGCKELNFFTWLHTQLIGIGVEPIKNLHSLRRNRLVDANEWWAGVGLL